MDSDDVKPFETLKREHESVLARLKAPALGKVSQEFTELFNALDTATQSATNADRKIQELGDEHQALLEQVSGKDRAFEDVSSRVKILRQRIEEAKSKTELLEGQQPSQQKEVRRR